MRAGRQQAAYEVHLFLQQTASQCARVKQDINAVPNFPREPAEHR